MKMTGKTRIRLLSLLLCVLMTVGALAGCANGHDDTTDTGNDTGAVGTEQETEAPDPYKTLDTPDVTFNNKTFRVLSIEHDSLYTAMDVPGISSEPVNNAIYERNRLIEDKYKFKLRNETDIWQNTSATLERQVQSGATSADDGYDIVMLICREAYSATLKNYLRDYEDLSYIDLNKEYYFNDINEQFSIGGKNFFAYGAESINALGQANCLCFNKGIATDRAFGDIYEMVDNKTWTYDQMFTMAANAATDKDGDGKLTLGTDVMGFIGDFDLTIPAVWVSAGENIIEKDEDDLPFMACYSSDRFYEVTQKGLDAFAANWSSVFTANDDKTDVFSANKAMFYCGCVCHLSYLKSMPDDYGVVPFPMYDENQDAYHSRLVDGWVHCVPTTCTDTDMTSIIMQALAYYSYQTVYDVYYENALTAKYVRDVQSVEMLKLILSTLSVDLGDTVWYAKIRAPLVDKIVQDKGTTSISSTIKSYRRIIQGLCKDAETFAETGSVKSN